MPNMACSVDILSKKLTCCIRWSVTALNTAKGINHSTLIVEVFDHELFISYSSMKGFEQPIVRDTVLYMMGGR